MEQTKNEPRKRTKRLPTTGNRKRSAKPLTEAQRLKRQKMIVLPAMVLVFIGAMWLIFAPSSGKEQPPGTDGYNTEMPDADKANRRLSATSESLRAWGDGGAAGEPQPCHAGSWATCSTARWRKRTSGRDFDLANPGGKEERAKPATPQDHPILRSRLPRPERHARQLLRAAEERQCGDGRTVGAHRLAGIGTGKREGQGFRYGRPSGTHGEVL